MQYANSPNLNSLAQMHTDIAAPRVGIDVTIDNIRGTLWVNVDGVCVLRVSQFKSLIINQLNQKATDAERT